MAASSASLFLTLYHPISKELPHQICLINHGDRVLYISINTVTRTTWIYIHEATKKIDRDQLRHMIKQLQQPWHPGGLEFLHRLEGKSNLD